MIKNILFICEGSTEIFLLYKILEKELKLKVNSELKEAGNLVVKKLEQLVTIFVENENLKIYVGNLKGERNLNNYVEELRDNRILSELNRVIFIMDADYSLGNETGFERTKKAILQAEDILKEGSSNIEMSSFIAPNNKEDGMSETILVKALKCREITSYIVDEVIPKVKTLEGQEIKNEDKSRFMMVAATQNPLRGTASSFISTCYEKLDKNNEYLKKIIDFIVKSIN